MSRSLYLCARFCAHSDVADASAPSAPRERGMPPPRERGGGDAATSARIIPRLVTTLAVATAIFASHSQATCSAASSPTLRTAVRECQSYRHDVPYELRSSLDLLCDELAFGHVALFALVLLNLMAYVPAIAALPWWGVRRGDASNRRLLTYQFCHANAAHLSGNMLTLLAVGSEVSDALDCDPLQFAALYLACGWVGGIAASELTSANAVTVGASGSISGVIVALSVLRPHDAVTILGDLTAANPLMLLLGTLAADLSRGGVSWQAHLGGGAAGFVLASLRVLLRERF